jgi:hypothetical protein
LDGQALYVMAVGSLTSRGSVTPARGHEAPTAGLLWPIDGDPPGFVAFLPIAGRWYLCDERGQGARRTGLNWTPAQPAGGTLRSVSVSWWRADPDHIEVVGLASSGAVSWAILGADGGGIDLLAAASSREGGYLAATRTPRGLIAAVRPDRVDWLRMSGDRPVAIRSTPISIPSAVACFASPATTELVVVCADGFVARVKFP